MAIQRKVTKKLVSYIQQSGRESHDFETIALCKSWKNLHKALKIAEKQLLFFERNSHNIGSWSFNKALTDTLDEIYDLRTQTFKLED